MKTDYWIYKNGIKVYIEEKIFTRNEDKAIDYEMEEVLAGLQTGSFNEDNYYELKYDRTYN
jgi:Fe-S cluster assembly iron-binding protein IscA